MSNVHHWCKTCASKMLKWGAVFVVLHALIHVVAWCISPALGAALLALL